MQHTYQTLFSKTSTGATQIWFMEIDGDKIRSTSGQINGEKVTTAWTKCFAKNVGKKNQTTASEQAAKEIEQQYKKKLKDKYFLSEADIGDFKFFRPMLAKGYADYVEKILWKRGVAVQNKYNGMRCIATIRGLHTRKGERITSVPHIWEAVKHIFVKNPEAVLDGELYNHDYRQSLNCLIKLCRKTVNATSEDLAESKKLVKFYVYDGALSSEGLKLSYEKRQKEINGIISDLKYCEKVKTWMVYSPREMEAIYKSLVDDGNEGVILRLLDAPYENKRSKNLLKYKPIDDGEFKLIAVKEGDGDWAGKAKVLTFEMDDGRTFDATFKGTMEEAALFLLEADAWLDEKYTVFYFGLTGLGTPNYAQFDINNFDKGDR